MHGLGSGVVGMAGDSDGMHGLGSVLVGMACWGDSGHKHSWGQWW